MDGQLAAVPVVVGSTMEDGYLVPANCADPANCTQHDFEHWASDGYGFNSSETARLAAIYRNDPGRPGLSNGTSWYWAQVHAGADVQSTCPARRTAQWVTNTGQRAWWYYWEYEPKDPQTGASLPAAHCAELKFLWGLRCGPDWLKDKPWAKAQCDFGIKFAGFWASFAARGDPTDGPTGWPAYGRGGGALVVGEGMRLERVAGLRRARCDFWDSHFPAIQ